MAQNNFSFLINSGIRILLLLFSVTSISVNTILGALFLDSASADTRGSELDSLLSEISQSNYWKKLVHYKSRSLFSGYESDITDPAFFLSPAGRQDPLQELIATLDAFKSDALTVCRFPARYFWLSRLYGEKLYLESGKLENCTEFQKWKKQINPGSATLIFPAAYLNGPSSMFGHTLLRIEPDDERSALALITYAVNYAANVQQKDNNALFAFKGIFGGYPGVMSIVPYHEKIKEYGEIENRDIWEYRLNLDKAEIAQMMRHAWEMKELRSAYYFFDLNCSYLILNLIEVGRENVNLTNQFSFKVIPVDTVRAVVDSGLVSRTEYRPAASTQLSQHYELLNADQRKQLNQLVTDQPDLEQVRQNVESDTDYARILEIAYDVNRYHAFQTPNVRDRNATYNLKLLQARSKVGIKEIWPEIRVPEDKPDKGHKSARAALGWRNVAINGESHNEFVLKVRPAYHDLLDPGYGFPFGAQINFLDFILSYDSEEREANIDQLTIIDILSLTPMHDLFDPISWRVDFGYESRNIFEQHINVLQVSPGFGKSGFLVSDLLAYALIHTTLEYSPDYESDYALGAGFQVGLLYTDEDYSTMLELQRDRYFAGEEDTRFSAMMGVARHLGKNLSVRLSVNRENLYEQYINQYQLDMNWYF